MSRQISELETILAHLIVEHQKLLKHIEVQQEAMKALDLRTMEDATHLQESTRLRIATLENRRRALVTQLARGMKLTTEPTVRQLADLFPQRRDALLKLREALKEIMTRIAARAGVAGRLAGALTGHLNTVMRILAGAVEQAGVYTKQGVPRVASRIGVMEAVG